VSVSEWEKAKVGGICIKIGSGATPTGGANSYKASGISLIRSQNVLDYQFSFDGLAFIDDEQADKLKGVTVEDGDILLNITGDSVARSCIVPKEVLPARVNQHVSIVRVDKSKAFNKYVFYYIQNMKPLLLSLAGNGGTRNALTKAMIEQLDISLPSLPEQKAIAATLSALDDMIELNNKVNKTLEEMAQAIFKSWFVDFEPFRDGEFEESELGLIPKGWRVVELGEITEEIRERVKDRKIPVFSAVKTGDLVLSEDYFTKQVFSRDISKYIVVKPFDFAYNPARINIGSIGINEFSYTGCVSPVYVVFRTDQKYKWFFKMLTRTERFKKEVNTRASGSVRQTLNFDEFSKIKVVYPYAEIVEEYNYIFEGLIMAKSKIEEEISILSEIRDTLLPKLMSGEIRVPVEEVV
jgi:type I restriction enzyme S subunit